MAKTRVRFSFPPKLIKDPIIYLVGKNFKLVTNIRRAEVEENKGWVILELEGEEAEIKRGWTGWQSRAYAWIRSQAMSLKASAIDKIFHPGKVGGI